jgi:hypothetical protein
VSEVLPLLYLHGLSTGDFGGSMHHHVHHVAAAPVVPDQVDRFIETLKLVFEPVTVGQVGSREAVGQRGAESRR